MTFNALMLTREEGAPPEAQITQLNNSDLPQDGNVTIAIAFSGLNYKDGLCLLGKAGLVRSYPHIAGIDFAGTVIESDDKRYQEGDQVVLTGWESARLGGEVTPNVHASRPIGSSHCLTA